ncbi:MAG: FIST C-terminal domain-containing protein [Candidatus Thiodiazotropha sp. (ex Monitilora ramsayi)]|nr:FIST C-terminal domain-containing protein [Candidatus Thiodiazotropha sp. (ex Monitilora ramsayi)]
MYLPFNSTTELVELLSAGHPNQVSWLLCFSYKHADKLPSLFEAAHSRGLQFCGGLFPGLIDGATPKDDGVLAIPLPEGSRVVTATISRDSVEWTEELPPLTSESSAKSSMLLFVDCLSPGITRFLEEVYDQYGTRIHYAGAGAGYANLQPKPVIFTEAGFIPHGGLLILMAVEAISSVQHGWKRIAGPFIATRTNGNIIQELNWESAGSIYRGEVESIALELKGKPVFPDLNSRFPLSIGKQSSEDVVRDPIEINSSDEIVVLSDVPENSAIYISEGSKETIVEAVRSAVRECDTSFQISFCFVSDCYSRALMLGDDIEEELEAACEELKKFTNAPLQGVLALGEICGNGRSNLEFYNKTFVISVAHKV